MKEVEMKSWILPEKKDELLIFLDTQCERGEHKIKRDTMYCVKGEKRIAFRIREEGDDIFITRKSRQYSDDGAEINTEIEFPVSSATEFAVFMEDRGFEVLYTKEKKVQQYTFQETLIEYVVMDGLGEFLEVEEVCQDEDVADALERILDILKVVNLDENIETKPYGVLLGEL